MFMQNTTSSLEMMLIKYYNFDGRENTSTLVPYRVHRREGHGLHSPQLEERGWREKIVWGYKENEIGGAAECVVGERENWEAWASSPYILWS
jgi:hypothetical protein